MRSIFHNLRRGHVGNNNNAKVYHQYKEIIFKHFLYMVIFTPPWVRTLTQGVINYTILVEGFMDIINHAFSFLKGT